MTICGGVMICGTTAPMATTRGQIANGLMGGQRYGRAYTHKLGLSHLNAIHRLLSNYKGGPGKVVGKTAWYYTLYVGLVEDLESIQEWT